MAVITDQWKWIYRAWRYRFKLEPSSVRFLMAHLRPGDVAVDIGAHKGAFTYWMGKCVGSKGRVYAFEPQPLLAGRLQKLTSAGFGKNIAVENVALSSGTDEATLHVPGGGCSPSASLEHTSFDSANDECYTVPVTTLDDHFGDRLDNPVKLIKCDVEGHELDVFRGGKQLLSSCHPYLLFECETRHRSSGTVDEVFSYLIDLGYKGCYLSRQGPIDIDRFDAATHQSDPDSGGYVNNFAFSPPPTQGLRSAA